MEVKFYKIENKNFLKIFILFGCIFFSNTSNSQNNLHLTKLNTSCETAIITSWVWFPFGYQSTCPDLSGYLLNNNPDTLILKLFYDISGPWPQVGCDRFDTLAFSISNSNLYLEGEAYSIFYNDTTLVSTDIIELCLPNHINEYKKYNPPIIFPNPANDYLYLQLNKSAETPIKMDIINSVGELIVQEKINKDRLFINIEYLPGGVYFLKIHFENFIHSQKIIKF
jgi:hypothetical protein